MDKISDYFKINANPVSVQLTGFLFFKLSTYNRFTLACA